MVSTVTDILSILTIVAQIAAVALLLAFIAARITKKENALTSFASDNAILAAFIVALTATAGSLFYSEVAGYEPCKLCWLQRILMYPQVVTLGLALWDKNRGVIHSTLALSLIGGVIAAYHYLGQVTDITKLSCTTVGYSVSCSQRFVMEFGYITIPLMALSAFVLIAVLMMVKKFSSTKHQV